MKFLIQGAKLSVLAVLLFCTYQYGKHKYAAHSMPFDQVVNYCTGNQTMDSVCECFNYYGRKCLSSKRLVWDWTPGDLDEEAPKASPERIRDLIEEQEAEGQEESA